MLLTQRTHLLLKSILVFLLPLMLIAVNARVACTKSFLHMEYQRKGFPADPYGFTTADRMQYGVRGLSYLFNGAGIGYLGQMRFPDNKKPMFNRRELRHMRDVKNVVRRLELIAYPLLFLFVLLLLGLVWVAAGRQLVVDALYKGAIWTFLLLGGSIGVVAVAFEPLFLKFHDVLGFAPGTFLFYADDTLIRLYPQQFWMDAFLLVLGGAVLEALLIGGGAWYARRRLRRVPAAPSVGQ